MYQIVIDLPAQKQLGKISAPYFNSIVKAILLSYILAW